MNPRCKFYAYSAELDKTFSVFFDALLVEMQDPSNGMMMRRVLTSLTREQSDALYKLVMADTIGAVGDAASAVQP